MESAPSSHDPPLSSHLREAPLIPQSTPASARKGSGYPEIPSPLSRCFCLSLGRTHGELETTAIFMIPNHKAQSCVVHPVNESSAKEGKSPQG